MHAWRSPRCTSSGTPGARADIGKAQCLTGDVTAILLAFPFQLSNHESVSPMDSLHPGNQPLHDRVILVTGALEGLGRAVALACAEAGASVILSSFRERDLEPVYDAIEEAGHPQPAMLPLDLEQADEDTFIAAANVIGETFGRLDGLAHCATFAPYLARLDDYEAKEWDRVMRVNLTAPFLLTQACLPLLRAAPEAAVVFTADQVGRKGRAYWGAYAAAKSGIEGLMQTIADEFEGSTLRCNSFDPGVLRTVQRATLYPGENPHQNPEPDRVASHYVRLLGPQGRGWQGQALSLQDLID